MRVAVTDPSGAVVVDAQVLVSDESHGTQRAASSEDDGGYTLQGLDPGLYRLEVTKPGFEAYIIEKLRLHGRESQTIRVALRISTAAKQSVTVAGEYEGVAADPSTGAAVDGKYLANLPVNDRSFTSLLQLAPGVTNAGDGPDGGIHANGLRSNTNYYTIDGVSANTGVGGGVPAGPGPGGPGGPGAGAGSGANGTSAATNASGSSSNLISLDAIQEMRVQVSTFAPEFGRSPGAQISITSRGGTNEFHGSTFEFLRDSRFNANDWFNDARHLSRGNQRLNDVGGTLGGPIHKDRTFIFLSFEGSHNEQPHTEIDTVPDNTIRTRAKAPLRPYLNAFPIANGPALGSDAAEFDSSYSTPSTSSSESIRVDHVVNSRLNGFIRYSRSPSTASNRGGIFSAANQVSKSTANTQSLTGSATWINDDNQIHNLRLNASRTVSRSSSYMDNFGGAALLSDKLLFPSGIDSGSGTYSFNIQGVGGYSTGGRSSTAQNQFNAVFDESGTAGKITAKIGLDYRLLMPTYRVKPYTQSVSFNGLSGNTDAFLSGTAQTLAVTSNVTDRYPLYQNFAAYYQHAYKYTRDTTLTYGVRWDINPAPGVRSGDRLLGLDSSLNPSTSSPLYHTKWFNFAPRFGLASELTNTPQHEWIFRGGIGLFYDTGYGATAGAFSNAPYANTTITTEPSFPLSSDLIAAPVLPATKPYGQINAADPNLKSPIIIEFNATMEKNMGPGRSATLGFIGSNGSSLLTTRTQPGFFTGQYSLLQMTTNGGISEYRAIQSQFRQTVGRFLLMQLSYTLGHSIDSQSSDSGFAGFAIQGGDNKGDSTYDIRHSFTATGSLSIPSPGNRLLRTMLGGWYADWVVSARSALPFDVQGQTVTSGSSCTSSSPLCMKGFASFVRPNLTGKPIWIDDPKVPGGRRLNVAAFSTPSSGQGNLKRNGIRGFDSSSVDISIRKQFRLTERYSVMFRADAYNALNHPIFANPNPLDGANLASSNFGVATRMLYNAFGGGSVQSSGAPRSVQFSFRLLF